MTLLFTLFSIDAWSQNSPLKCHQDEREESVGSISICVKTETIPLINSTNLVTVKTYTKRMQGKVIDRTFVVVHNNEQKGLNAVKEVIAEKGGRLVEVDSNYTQGVINDEQHRFLFFGDQQKYCIDPNRIFSVDGFSLWLKRFDETPYCKKIDNDPQSNTFKGVLRFGRALRAKIEGQGISFIIGVHNNTGTSVNDWKTGGGEAHRAIQMPDKEPASPYPTPPDNNFVLVSNRKLYDQLITDPVCCYVALQLSQKELKKANVANKIDDGSMSIFYGASANPPFSTRNFAYINIEAYGKENKEGDSKAWQKKIIERALTLNYK